MRQPREVLSRVTHTYALILTLILISLTISCSRNSDGNSRGDNEGLIPSVEAVQARFGSLPLTERLSGVVKAMNQVELYPQVSAQVAQVYVQNGNPVQSGEPLVRLRDTEFREQLKQAEANYQIALAQAKQAEAELKRMQAELQRSRDLAEKELISPTE
ncbi:MAG: biotin/lipoyl-binding protein, partial [candidate division Zixibacteria bacterium]|nr:biotin/lipoyl-binding protein [candidate division Zixibacteria bacterium]NIR62547.1 biotin/lipoyl-binding protein [candidate division Zixibacteria bacterium]NIS18260.1 biotin/lipoyl-binding protein [candidate division Zixibacteria bacterium]NIS44680.1 biotin/lipoyl-binding protein [candidate division Zixibacteria bacterium]NIT54546.1 biotin/lipoyl-binding protein [candidate division Zixibacteria bacterium]